MAQTFGPDRQGSDQEVAGAGQDEAIGEYEEWR